MNEEKNKIQEKVRVLSKEYPYLAFMFATRTGKTIAGLKVIKEHGGKWNIVVAEIQHIQQWKDEFIYFDMEEYLQNVNIFCYQSLHKHFDQDINWIFDEAHHMFTRLRWNIIAILRIPRALFLSPYLDDNQIDKLKNQFVNFKQLNLSLETAIKKGILPTPKIYLISLSLNNTKTSQSFKVKTGDNTKREVFKDVSFKDKFKYLGKYKHLHLSITCTEQQKYELISNEIEYKKDLHAKYRTNWTKLSLLKTGLKRKQFLAQIKTPIIRDFLKTIKDKRYICFTSSIQQCQQLGGNVNIVHSQKKLNNLVLKKFNDKKINSLFVVNMLTEGTNLTDVDIGIIIQLDGVERRYIQKSGRVYLSKYPEQYIFYYKNTSDERLIQHIIKNKLNSEYIKELPFDELIKK